MTTVRAPSNRIANGARRNGAGSETDLLDVREDLGLLVGGVASGQSLGLGGSEARSVRQGGVAGRHAVACGDGEGAGDD